MRHLVAANSTKRDDAIGLPAPAGSDGSRGGCHVVVAGQMPSGLGVLWVSARHLVASVIVPPYREFALWAMQNLRFTWLAWVRHALARCAEDKLTAWAIDERLEIVRWRDKATFTLWAAVGRVLLVGSRLHDRTRHEPVRLVAR